MLERRPLRIAARRKSFLLFFRHLLIVILLVALTLFVLLWLKTEGSISHRGCPRARPLLQQTRGTSQQDHRGKPGKTNDFRCRSYKKMREEQLDKRRNGKIVEDNVDAGKDFIAPVPFFWGGGNEGTRGMASHLDYRVEQYRQDLVKVVQGMDLIINRLEEAAARESTEKGDMPGAGIRRLAAKFRRKLEKTPPRWQVNTDILERLLRTVPFVAGLPAPCPAPAIAREATPGNYEYSKNCASVRANETNATPVAPMIEINGERSETEARDFCDGVGSYRGAQDADSLHGDAERGRVDASSKRVGSPGHERAVYAGGDAGDRDVSGADGGECGINGSEVLERRAAPFVHGPAATLAESLDDIANGGSGVQGDEKNGKSAGRAGFYSYDETYQIFTHMVRDWTSEGDSVRAAVYDPLVQALDCYVGWQDVQAPDAATGDGTSAKSAASCTSFADQKRRGKHKSRGTRRRANVLVPGAGLGRLAAEIAARGYASVHANEMSLTMLACSYWLIEAIRGDGSQSTTTPLRENRDNFPPHPSPVADFMIDRGKKIRVDAVNGEKSAEEPVTGRKSTQADGKREVFEFYPFLNDAMHNEMDGEARFRPALFPDPAGRAVLALASHRLSYQAGEFSATYGAAGGPFEGYFDAVVTSFFIDTAPNVVEYVAAIRRTLRVGGVWINCGPLHWHNKAALALSLDEMLALVAGSGFHVEAVERFAPSAYRVEDGERSLKVEEFRPVFWVAILEEGRRE